MDEQILERAGCAIHYWLTGDPAAPLMILTHGAGADHRMFDPQIAVLATSYRVLTWDVRGHGRSRPLGGAFAFQDAVEDLLALLDAVGRQQAILVGQSMGGNIGQEVAFRQPERVRALVVIDSTCNTGRLTTVEKLSLASAPAIFRFYPWETLKRQSAAISADKPEVRTYIYEAMSQLSKDEFVAIMMATTTCLHEEPAYRIAQPFLLTHGAHDGTGNIRRIAPGWAAREPHCRYVVIPDAGHAANMDNPAFFNRVLLEFLATVS